MEVSSIVQDASMFRNRIKDTCKLNHLKRKFMSWLNKIYNEDCLKGIKRIPDASIDCILTDPPYLYLKGQKLERPFDEPVLFNEFKRVLKPNGFIVLFGRGVSFYRWNTILSELGLEFKEEVVWDKVNTTSPLNPISRKHETVSIFCKGSGMQVNRVKVSYDEMREFDNIAVVNDAKRIISYVRNNDIEHLKYVARGGNLLFNQKRTHKSHVSSQTGFKSADRALYCVSAINNGCNERDIISVQRDHYKAIHPTQKPVRLIERLLALVTKPGDVVMDPFIGSCSTAIACIDTNRKYIGFEIDSEYYEAGINRINETFKI